MGVQDIVYSNLHTVFPPLKTVMAVLVSMMLGLGAVAEHVQAGEAIEQIRFARGASGAEVTGSVIRGERALYMFNARAGQTATLQLSALEDNAAFQIYAPGAKPEIQDSIMEVLGDALPGAAEGDDAAEWKGTLPGSGGYLIVIGPTRGNAEYKLKITIR
jgi:hypothetical protein